MEICEKDERMTPYWLESWLDMDNTAALQKGIFPDFYSSILSVFETGFVCVV